MLITTRLLAQPGRGHSNGFIMRQSRVTGIMHANAAANARAINHANSNSVFGTTSTNDKKRDNVNNSGSSAPGDVKQEDNDNNNKGKSKSKKHK